MKRALGRGVLGRAAAGLPGAVLARHHGLVPGRRFRLARPAAGRHGLARLLDALFGAARAGHHPALERARLLHGASTRCSAWTRCPSASGCSSRSSPNLALVAWIARAADRVARGGLLAASLLDRQQHAGLADDLDLGLQPGPVRLLPAAGVPLPAALHRDRAGGATRCWSGSPSCWASARRS